MSYDTRIRSGPALPKIPDSIDPRKALAALRRCFSSDGTVLLIKPEASQFRPVEDNERAISILDAVDIALRGRD